MCKPGEISFSSLIPYTKLYANFNKTNVVNPQTYLLMCVLVAGQFRLFSLCLRTFNRSFSVTWSRALQIAWNKRKFLHVKKSSIPTGFFLYTNMAPIHCFVQKYGHRDVMWKRSIIRNWFQFSRGRLNKVRMCRQILGDVISTS